MAPDFARFHSKLFNSNINLFTMSNPVPTKSWQRLSFEHVASARFFSDNALEIEHKSAHAFLQRPQYLDLRFHHHGYVIGAIFAAVAFLDATINELFLEADKYERDKNLHQKDLVRQLFPSDTPFQDPLTPLTQDAIKRLAEVWNRIKIKFSEYPGLHETLVYPHTENNNPARKWFVLDKYQLALYLANKEDCSKIFDTTNPLWVEADVLIKLRHYLMHYSPEWIAFEPRSESYEAQKETTASLVNELRKRNFKNPLIPEGTVKIAGNSVVVTGFSSLLGANCADWAATQSLKFVCEFAKRMPVEQYEKMYCP